LEKRFGAAEHQTDSTRNTGQVVGLFPDLLGLGGIQEASRQMVCALQNIFARRGWSAAYLGLNDPTGSQTLRVADHSIPFRGYQRSKIRFVLRALQLARKRPRIVIAAHPNLAVPARLMKNFSLSTKTIVLCHGVEVWEPLPPRRRKALLAADLVLVPSTYTAERLTHLQGIPAERIRVLPWPVNSEILRMSNAPADLPLPAGFPAGSVVLTVGRWAASERYKGADDLIRTLPKLLVSFPDLHIVAIGSGDDLPRLKEITADLGLATSVLFLERISREQLAACYAHADVFALPSSGEGFGIVFLEAMAFGLPVIGAAAGGVTDIVKHGANGLLIPGKDPAMLVRALAQLLHDPGLRTTLGKRGAEIVREKYGFEIFERHLEDILMECGMDSMTAA
jgi:glycosyltransferase involved in cell wall biosynthesis